MNRPCHPHDDTAWRGRPCAGAAWLGFGTTAFAVVANSNLPAAIAGNANRLLKPSRVAP